MVRIGTDGKVYDMAPGTFLHIDELWAFVSVDEDGHEGICAQYTRLGVTPLIGADKDRVQSLRPIAEDIARNTGREVKLVKFSVRTEVEVIK